MSQKKHPLPALHFDAVHAVHIIGVGGVVLSALAELMRAWGRKVSGSDMRANERTERLSRRGAAISITRKIAHLPPHTDLVIVSPRVPRNHPDLILAKQLGIPIVATAEILGIISRLHDTISVAGCHGKTSVATYIGTLLEKEGKDPSVLVRTDVDVWQGNFRCGKGDYFVTEADENQRRFLALSPKIALIMNIEADHLDYFKDLKAVVKAYHEFTHELSPDAICIVNGDDPHVQEVVKRIRARVVRFGTHDGADVRAIGITSGEKGVSFTVHIKRGEGDIQIDLALAGVYQITNALAVIATAQILGLSLARAKEVIESYPGGAWHLERVGEKEGLLVIDDAADHPSEITMVLQGVRSKYPDRKIWCVFQPYLLNRTQYLMEEFAQSFTNADRVFILPIVQGAEEGGGTTSASFLADAAKKYHLFVEEITDPSALQTILAGLPPEAILLTLGADSVRKVGDQFLTSS